MLIALEAAHHLDSLSRACRFPEDIAAVDHERIAADRHRPLIDGHTSFEPGESIRGRVAVFGGKNRFVDLGGLHFEAQAEPPEKLGSTRGTRG
jgi:hypothetical protein